jgi:hypothetical protein
MEDFGMNIIDIVVGALLLTLGRKLFWLFVAGVGFSIGLQFATQYLNVQPAWLGLLIAIGAGLIGAVLAYFFQKALIGIAGFLAGALITWQFLTLVSVQVQSWAWILIILGGVIGLIVMVGFFEWALIILSSLAGAILIVMGFNLAGILALVIGVILFIAGVVFQGRVNRRYVPPPTAPNVT